MIRFVLTIAVLFCSQVLFAQVRATTESGNKVLLFDNGTWRYEEKKMDAPVEPETKVSTPVTSATPTTPVVAAIAAPAVPVVSTIKIDESRDIQTDPEILYNTTSKRLERFFGEAKAQTRCKVSCSNKHGEIKIHFVWEFPVGDGNRYYGYFKEGSLITLHFLDGQKVELLTAENAKLKTLEKYNFTTIESYSQPLNTEQLQVLSTQPVLKLEVDWKKTSEVYDVENSRYFNETLPEIF